MKEALQFLLILIILSSCGQETMEKKYRYQFNVKNEDTTKNYTVFSDLKDEYDFYDKKEVEKIILNESSLQQTNGDFSFGFINTNNKKNKILFFFSDSSKFPSFPNKDQELKTAWKEEIKSLYPESSANVSLYERYEDSEGDKPVKLSTFLITDSKQADTLGYQDIKYVMTQSRLVTMVMFYSSQRYKHELLNIFSDFKNKNKSNGKEATKDSLNNK